MEKKELIDYLTACIDAEQGAYETDRLVGELNFRINKIEQKDYKDGKLIPKPEILPLEYHDSCGDEPELELESEYEYKEKVMELTRKLSSERRENHKLRMGFLKAGVVVLIALTALGFYFITSGSFVSFVKDTLFQGDSLRVGDWSWSPYILFQILKAMKMRDFICSVVGFFMLFGLMMAVFTKVDDSDLENKDALSYIAMFAPFLCILWGQLFTRNPLTRSIMIFSPFIIYLFIILLTWLLSQIKSNKEEYHKLINDEALLRHLETEYANVRKRNEDRRNEYELNTAEYEKTKAAYLDSVKRSNDKKTAQYKMTVRNTILVDSLTRNTLIAERKKQEETHAEFVKKKDELYSKNYIHENFRNIAALMQIRAYLEMGLADKLQGSDGAYAEYMKDVRTEKIVGSIDSLRSTIEKGITVLAHGQEVLYKELITANMNLNILSSDLNNSLKKIDRSIFDMKFDLEEAIRDEGYRNRDAFSNSINSVISYSNMINESNRDAYSSQLQQIVDSQRSLLDTVEKSSYNQYLVAKKENVDNYIYSSLRDPR